MRVVESSDEVVTISFDPGELSQVAAIVHATLHGANAFHDDDWTALVECPRDVAQALSTQLLAALPWNRGPGKETRVSGPVWVAQVQVQFGEESPQELREAAGAFVHVAARADDEAHFLDRAHRYFQSEGMQVLEFEDVTLFDSPEVMFAEEGEVAELARDAERTGAVVNGSYHSYNVDGDD